VFSQYQEPMSTIGIDERRAPNTSIEISCRMIIAAGYIAVIVVVVLALIWTMQRHCLSSLADTIELCRSKRVAPCTMPQ
jgi:hypothetical protein